MGLLGGLFGGGGSSSDATKKFTEGILRMNWNMLQKTLKAQQAEIEKHTASSGSWKKATMPIPDVEADVFMDPKKDK